MLSTTLAVLRPTPGSSSQRLARVRHLAAVLGDQLLRQRDDVLRLGAKEPDGLDQLAHALLAERRHLLRRVGEREQRRRRLVDAGVGRLRRQHHRDQQRERIDVLQLALRLRHRRLEAAERFLDLGRASRAWCLPCSALSSALARAFGGFDLGGLALARLFHRRYGLGWRSARFAWSAFSAMFALY